MNVFRCVENGGERWHVGKAHVVNRVEMEPDTEVCLKSLIYSSAVRDKIYT